MTDYDDEKRPNVAAGVVGVAALAAVAGAVAALLLAPKSGKDTRADIKKHVDEAKKKSGDVAGDARKRVEEQVQRRRIARNKGEVDEAIEAEVEERRGFWGRK